jgi:hypothetical protein
MAPNSSGIVAKGSNFASLLGALERKRGKAARELVCEQLSGPFGDALRYGQVVAVGWYPVEWYAALHAAIDRALHGGPELARELGRLATRADFTTLHRALASMLKVETAFAQAPRLMGLYWKGGKIDCPLIGPGRGKLRFVSWSGFTRLIWEDLAGSVEAIIALCGAQRVISSPIDVPAHSDRLELDVCWSAEQSFRRWV